MRIRLQKQWEAIRASYWFLPTLMLAAAVGLSLAMAALDRRVDYRDIPGMGWIFTGGPEGARAVLSTIAGSMITVAGVSFSIVIVALSQTSSQFGPRILRNFMRDRGNQVVLGTFVGTFLYCLLVLRAIRGDAAPASFVPNLSVTVGVALAVASLGVLIYFIHHAAVSIQAPEVVAEISRERHHTVGRLFPGSLGRSSEPGREAPPLPESVHGPGRPIPSSDEGYLQGVDEDALMRVARECDLVLRLERRPGHFVVRGGTLVRAWPAERASDGVVDRINEAFVIGTHRTPTQDVEYSIRQLVEIAVRALSPGVNDPFTAMDCVDRLGAALAHLAELEFPSPYRYDDGGTLRIVASPVTFEGAVNAALDQIRQNARGNAAVSIRLLEALEAVAEHVRLEERCAVLRRHAQMVHRAAHEALPQPDDREDLDRRYRALLRRLEREDAPSGAARPDPV